jgi:hypothetical protein
MPPHDNVRQFEQRPGQASGLEGGSGDGQIPSDMSERVARLEAAVKGLRDGINIVLAVVGVVVLILLYAITRIDTVNDRVNALPNQISADLRDIVKMIAETSTAAKQQPPQVILVPEPSVQQQPPKR